MKNIEITLNNNEIARFWTLVENNQGSKCWPWIGSRDKAGYGVWYIRTEGKKKVFYKPHRVAFLIMTGSLDPALSIDHLCRNRACCNPAHLQEVTLSVNVKRVPRNVLLCKRGHHKKPGACTECNTYRQQRWREANPGRAKEIKQTYYKGKGRATRKAAWERFKAGYQKLEPPKDEDQGYSS